MSHNNIVSPHLNTSYFSNDYIYFIFYIVNTHLIISFPWDYYFKYLNRIVSVIVCVFVSSAVDREFEPPSCQTKDYTIGICYFSTKYM
jgi:hypothetical protein